MQQKATPLPSNTQHQFTIVSHQTGNHKALICYEEVHDVSALTANVLKNCDSNSYCRKTQRLSKLQYDKTKHPLFHQILPASSMQHQVQVKRKHTGIVQAKDEQRRVGKITEKQEVDSIY